MQLTCDRVLFSAAFQTAASAVPARTPKDVLRNVYIHLGSGGVELVGTDQEVAIRFNVDGVETTVHRTHRPLTDAFHHFVATDGSVGKVTHSRFAVPQAIVWLIESSLATISEQSYRARPAAMQDDRPAKRYRPNSL